MSLRYEPEALDVVRNQAQRYLVARYGKNVWYRAPETFGNVLERWIWAVASNSGELAEQCMASIERHLAGADEGEGDGPGGSGDRQPGAVLKRRHDDRPTEPVPPVEGH